MFELWRDPRPLVLASSSETRRALLEGHGIPIEIRRPSFDERLFESGLDDAVAVSGGSALDLAVAKALSVSCEILGRCVLAADQVLLFDGKVFSKPASREHAREQLCALSGHTHVLRSAAVIAMDGGLLFEAVEDARMTMRTFSDEFLECYLYSMGERALQSVGAYQVEGLGIHLFEKIDGDHGTILGLPIMSILTYFRSSGQMLR